MKLLREWWPIIVAAITAVGLYLAIDRTLLFGFWPSFALSGIEAETRANLGALGDVMGGLLNPVLTFITIILLIQTIRISQKTLRQTEESLKISDETLKATKEQIELNRQELIETRAEIARSSEAQEEIAETQLIQRKENTFFQAYKIYSEIVVSVSTEEDFGEGRIRSIMRRSPAGSACSAIYTSGKSFDQKFEDAFLDNKHVRSFVQMATLCLTFSDSNPKLDEMISALMDKNCKRFICMYAWYSDEKDALYLKDAILSGRIFKDEIFVLDGSEYVVEIIEPALAGLNLSRH